MGIEVSIPGSQQPATETYFETHKSCPRHEPSLCNRRFSITKTSERRPFNIQPTSLNDENTFQGRTNFHRHIFVCLESESIHLLLKISAICEILKITTLSMREKCIHSS